jgi:hypothetical protein
MNGRDGRANEASPGQEDTVEHGGDLPGGAFAPARRARLRCGTSRQGMIVTMPEFSQGVDR